MGDRANFGIRQTDGNTIFVYGHWAGHGMLARFANALDKASVRLPYDDAYGTRIIVSQLIGDEWNQPLSWGITLNTLSDNEHKVPVYDLETDTVSLYDCDWYSNKITDLIFTMPRIDFVRKYSKTMIGV
jgi:hypothetical protein